MYVTCNLSTVDVLQLLSSKELRRHVTYVICILTELSVREVRVLKSICAYTRARARTRMYGGEWKFHVTYVT